MELSVKEQAVLFEAFKKDPLFFGRTVFPQVFYTNESPSFHKVIVDNIMNPKKQVTVIVVARGRAKSTISTFLMPIYLAMFSGYKYISIASLAGKRANEFLERIKDYLVDKNISNFPKIFGDVRGNKWSATQIDIKYNNEDLKINVDCRIDSLGSGMQFIGAVRRDTRPELIILDDVEDPDSVQNEEIINKYQERLFDGIIPSLDKRRGHILIIGTPYGHDSLLKRVYNLDSVYKIRIPALVVDDEDGDGYKLSELLGVDVGKSIWEAQFPTQEVIKEREVWAMDGNLQSWSAQKMCNFRVHDSVNKFDEDRIKYFKPSDVDMTLHNLFILVDVAYKKKKFNDPTGIVLVGKDREGDLYIYEAREGKWDDDQVINEVLDLANGYNSMGGKIKTIGFESIVYHMFLKNITKKMQSNGLVFPIMELKPENMPQQDRIRGLVTLTKGNNVFIRKEHTAIKGQMLKFDSRLEQKGLHMLDALAYICKIGMNPTLTPDEMHKEENHKLWSKLHGEYIKRKVDDGDPNNWDRIDRMKEICSLY